MYDTVCAYVTPSRRLDVLRFNGRKLTSDERGTVARFWYTTPSAAAGYEPRLNYYVNMSDPDDAGRLFVQFSVPKMVVVDLHGNVNDHQRDFALQLVNSFIGRFTVDVPDVREWTCVRVDYAINFKLDADTMPLYLSVVQSLQLASPYRKERYEGSGVVWRTDSRWVKFYDKGQELGDGRAGTLRFEVSNMRSAVRYLSDKFDGDRSVRAVLTAERAHYCLAHQWELMGLGNVDTYSSSALTLHKLRSQFASSASSAYYALHCIREHGTQAYHDGLMSQNNYYHWKRRLSEAGFLHTVDSHLAEYDNKSLPKLDLVQNLGVRSTDTENPAKKILRVKRGTKLPKILRGIYEAQHV